MSAWWWRRLPNRVSRISPAVGGLLGDGRHFGAVRQIGWLIAAAALVGGYVVGRTQSEFTYIGLLPVMIVLVSIGMLGAALGVWALVGYIAGDLLNPVQDALIAVTIDNYDFPTRLAQFYYPHALSYAVLVLLMVINPQAARAVGASIRLTRGPIAWAASAVVTAATAAFLSYLWGLSAQYLLRPLWTLRDGIQAVPVATLAPLNDHPTALAWAAGTAALVGVAMQAGITLTRPDRVRSLTPAPRATPPLASVLIGAPIKAALATALMTGVLEHWSRALLFAAGVTVVELLRTVVLPAVPVLPTMLERIPLLLRIAAAMGVAYVVTDRYIRPAMVTYREDFTPLVVAAFVAYAIAAVLFPGPVRTRRPARQNRRRPATPTVRPVVIVLILVAAWWSLNLPPAYADDCSGFSDCSLSQIGAMWATGGLFGLAAGAMLANRRGAAKSAAQQQKQDDLEHLGKDLAKSGQDVDKVSPEAKKIQDAINKARGMVDGVNPGAGKNNCALVADSVDQRFGGEISPIAPVIGDDSQFTPAEDSERWDGHGHTWRPGAGPAAAAEWVRETGGRGILHIDWAGGGGHVINVVPVDGTVLFVDGQQIPPAVSSSLDGLYPPSQVGGIQGYAFLPTWPPG